MLTQSQEDCIERRGACIGCPNALESMGWTCMVRWTRSVIRVLGEPRTKRPAVMTEPSYERIAKACQQCGKPFEAKLNSARYCPPCRVDRNRESSRRFDARKRLERKAMG